MNSIENVQNQSSKIAVAVLAAGSSARLGRPKQLLTFNGKALLQTIVEAALGSSANQIVVVLGASSASIRPALDPGRAEILINENWQEGMASSIRLAVEHLSNGDNATGAVVFLVCDQPYVTSDLIDTLISAYRQSAKSIACCRYGETLGVPALFSSAHFAELQLLQGDSGARRIIKAHAGKVEAVDFPQGVYDLDTDADLNELNQRGDEKQREEI